MIFAIMEKSTFDKSGIKRHEVASEFLTLVSFQYLWYTDRPFWGKTELGSIPYWWPRHYLKNEQGEHTFEHTFIKWQYLTNVNGFLVFSHFKKQNSTCLTPLFYLVDPANSHMLISKIKSCMSKYKHLYCETVNGSLNQLSFIWSF